MGLALAKMNYTAEEYYCRERAAAYKSEYVNGEILAMAGGSSRHSLIKSNLMRELGNRLKGKPCAPYDSDQRLRVKETGLRTYPDAAVYCGEMIYDLEDSQRETATNPTVVFEVLSDSTEAYDRGAKSAHYRRIEGLKAYVMISQNTPMVEMLHLVPGQGWQIVEATGLDAVLRIPCLEIELSLVEIYDRLKWDQPGLSIHPLQVIPPSSAQG